MATFLWRPCSPYVHSHDLPLPKLKQLQRAGPHQSPIILPFEVLRCPARCYHCWKEGKSLSQVDVCHLSDGQTTWNLARIQSMQKHLLHSNSTPPGENSLPSVFLLRPPLFFVLKEDQTDHSICLLPPPPPRKPQKKTDTHFEARVRGSVLKFPLGWKVDPRWKVGQIHATSHGVRARKRVHQTLGLSHENGPNPKSLEVHEVRVWSMVRTQKV